MLFATLVPVGPRLHTFHRAHQAVATAAIATRVERPDVDPICRLAELVWIANHFPLFDQGARATIVDLDLDPHQVRELAPDIGDRRGCRFGSPLAVLARYNAAYYIARFMRLFNLSSSLLYFLTIQD